jgi:hypothetical protein
MKRTWASVTAPSYTTEIRQAKMSHGVYQYQYWGDPPSKSTQTVLDNLCKDQHDSESQALLKELDRRIYAEDHVIATDLGSGKTYVIDRFAKPPRDRFSKPIKAKHGVLMITWSEEMA